MSELVLLAKVVSYCSLDAIEQYLQWFAETISDDDFVIALEKTCRIERMEQQKLLLQYHRYTDKQIRLAMCTWIEWRSLEKLLFVIIKYPHLSRSQIDVINIAAECNWDMGLRWLVAIGFSIHVRCVAWNYTSMMRCWSHVPSLCVLAAAGADVTIKSEFGTTVHEMAVECRDQRLHEFWAQYYGSREMILEEQARLAQTRLEWRTYVLTFCGIDVDSPTSRFHHLPKDVVYHCILPYFGYIAV